VRNGLAEVPEDAIAVLVHDAARPLVSDEVVGRVLAPLSEGWDGVVPGLPVTDTLKRVSEDGTVGETVSRDGLWAVQTPQAFPAEVLRRALAAGMAAVHIRRGPWGHLHETPPGARRIDTLSELL
jgi:2-C-methyl-D-erythritol 4-phosphate cytidylyltransferase